MVQGSRAAKAGKAKSPRASPPQPARGWGRYSPSDKKSKLLFEEVWKGAERSKKEVSVDAGAKQESPTSDEQSISHGGIGCRFPQSLQDAAFSLATNGSVKQRRMCSHKKSAPSRSDLLVITPLQDRLLRAQILLLIAHGDAEDGRSLTSLRLGRVSSWHRAAPARVEGRPRASGTRTPCRPGCAPGTRSGGSGGG
jgi:hypothetical protein